MNNDNDVKKWAASRFNINADDVVWYHGGCCYDRIGVKTKTAANAVSKAVKNRSVNGGWFHGMQLGSQSKSGGVYDVMC